jgi:hypothetical protein
MCPHQMRTTLQLDDDVVGMARVLARQKGSSLGAVISELARRGLRQPALDEGRPPARRNELQLLPLHPEGGPVDLQLVNSLRDELP